MIVTPAYLNGSCQVPPNDSPHIGHASFRYFSGSTQVQASVTCPLSFTPLAAAIHGPAQPNDTAPLIFDLGPFSVVTNIFSIISYPPATNWYTNISMVCTNTVNLNPQEMEHLQAGRFYLSVTSDEYPEGEIRGQITSSSVLSRPRVRSPEGFSFEITGPLLSLGYGVEATTNLIDWATSTNVALTTNHIFEVGIFELIKPGITIEVTDSDVANYSSRFYRAKQR